MFAGPTVIVTGKSPILNVKEQKTYDFRWVCVYVTGKDGWLLAVSQATRLPASLFRTAGLRPAHARSLAELQRHFVGSRARPAFTGLLST